MATPRRRYLSPLRYPGGKDKMATWLVDLFTRQHGLMDVEIWAEPFAGGLGAGLRALEEGITEEVWYCEANPALAAFWQTVATADGANGLARRVRTTTPTPGDFYDARDHLTAGGVIGRDPLDVAWDVLVVNRCSHSGILTPTAGITGGKSPARPDAHLARWAPDSVAARLEHLATFDGRLTWRGADGIEMLEDWDGTLGIEDEIFALVDPPYITQGNRLYGQGMTVADHERLAIALHASPTRWALTYDAHPDVLALYGDLRVAEFAIPYSTNTTGMASEYLVCSNLLAAPVSWEGITPTRGRDAWWVQAAP